MEYKGKLYGKVGKRYFPLVEPTEDIEKLRRSVGRSGEDYLLEIDRHKKHIKVLEKEIKPLLCPTCNKGGLYTHNGYIWCNNKKCEAIFEQQDT